MHQVSRTVDSITLSWSQPDQPNGVILDYELQYYEKVPVLPGTLPLAPTSLRAPLPSAPTSLRAPVRGRVLGLYHPARWDMLVKHKEHWPRLHASLAVRPQAGALTSLSLAFLL